MIDVIAYCISHNVGSPLTVGPQEHYFPGAAHFTFFVPRISSFTLIPPTYFLSFPNKQKKKKRAKMTTGFAVRKNGSCLRTESDCGETVGGFRGCCPGGTFCPHAYNIDCCPAGKNCTESLVQEPRCANATWDLYDNGGYFCCPHDTIGFALAGQFDGCAGTGYSFGDQDTRLKVISSGTGTLFTHTILYICLFYMDAKV